MTVTKKIFNNKFIIFYSVKKAGYCNDGSFNRIENAIPPMLKRGNLRAHLCKFYLEVL